MSYDSLRFKTAFYQMRNCNYEKGKARLQALVVKIFHFTFHINPIDVGTASSYPTFPLPHHPVVWALHTTYHTFLLSEFSVFQILYIDTADDAKIYTHYRKVSKLPSSSLTSRISSYLSATNWAYVGRPTNRPTMNCSSVISFSLK